MNQPKSQLSATGTAQRPHFAEHFLKLRNSGRKLLVPFMTGGIIQWNDALCVFEESGADAVELGIPFSDPVMDGPVICAANDAALANGVTPRSLLKEIKALKLSIPTLVMTYSNIAFRPGLAKFVDTLKSAGIEGAILADMPYELAADWIAVAAPAGISPVLLAAPTAADERLENISKLSEGFIYAVGLSGVTGERKNLAKSSIEIAKRLKQITDTPVLVGVGISTPAQAQQACEFADGVVVGSVLVRKLMEEKDIGALRALVGDFRKALD